MRPETTRRVVSAFLALALGAACAGPPTATPTAPPVWIPAPTPGPGTPTLPAPTVPPPATPLPTRPAVTICLGFEPESLFRYARPEADGGLSRAHLLALVEDGPLDQLAAGPQPALLERLPAGADVRVDTVSVAAGDRVVDALGRVVTLTAGLTFNLLDGEQVTYGGEGPLALPRRTVRFTLRPGLRWSDGAPLTAADSVFSFQLAADPAAYVPERERLARTAAYQAVDERTVEWTGWPGDLDPGYLDHFWPPLPAHALAGRPVTELAADPGAGRAPLSYGPFVLTRWAAGDQAVLERNPYYWRAAEGLPRLERVIVRFLPDPAALNNALLSGACEVAPRQPGWRTLADAGEPAFVRWAPGPEQVSLFFGLQPQSTAAAAPGFFADPRARAAVAQCLDRAALTPPPAPAERLAARALYPDVTVAFDPARGRAVLAELGWVDSDADGRADQGGRPLSVRLVFGPAADPDLAGAAQGVAAQLLANCGVTVAVQALTDGERLADWPDGPLFGRQFDLALLSWRTAGAPCAFFLSEQIAEAGNPAGANVAGYRAAAFDAACRRALTAPAPGPAAAEAEAQLARDLPVLPLFAQLRVAAARPEVAGLTLDPLARSELWNAETWTVWP
ncbi:MAG: hypothetical protein JNK29_06650 [Anaerolineales bacterium]|nr:hypothetical protein [Anaerolineales bacterium]